MCLCGHASICVCCLLKRYKPGPDIDSCSQSADTSGDSKTDTRDDSEIRTGLCSADLMEIQPQNRVISCECLLCISIYGCW